MEAFSPTQKRPVESAEDWDVFATISEDVDFRFESRGIIVGGPGTVNLVKIDGSPGTDPLPEMPAGLFYPCVGVGILLAGTTATNIIVLY